MDNSILKYTLIRFGSLLLVALCFGCSMNAQVHADSQKNNKVKLSAVYLGTGFGQGKRGRPSGASANLIFSNNWGAGISYKSRALRAGNTPDDYEPVIRSRGLFEAQDKSAKDYPREFFDVYSITLYRERITRIEKVRYGLEAGPSLVKYAKPSFRKSSLPYYNSFFGYSQTSNYMMEYAIYNAAGLSLRAKLEFPIGRLLGFEFAVFGNINKFRSFAGAEIYLTFGMVRQKINKI